MQTTMRTGNHQRDTGACDFTREQLTYEELDGRRWQMPLTLADKKIRIDINQGETESEWGGN